jgi:hypothetical protein
LQLDFLEELILALEDFNVAFGKTSYYLDQEEVTVSEASLGLEGRAHERLAFG